ncbi:MAG: hypothetical protein R6T89_08280 [Candidatus Syntrophosphaera sp.]
MRSIMFIFVLVFLAGLVGAQTLPMTDLGTGHFSSEMGVYVSGEGVARDINPHLATEVARSQISHRKGLGSSQSTQKHQNKYKHYATHGTSHGCSYCMYLSIV